MNEHAFADGNNRLLAALGDEYASIAPHLEEVEVPSGRCLFDVGEVLTHAYFPRTGVVSMVMLTDEGRKAVEIVNVGKEGMVGLPAVLATGSLPARAFGQIAGRAMRISAAALRREYARGTALNVMQHRYCQALFTHAARGAVCNALHSIEERCARWILTTQDRLERDELPLTQEFLAQMLAVRRASVTVAAGALQRADLIRYRRGKVTVLDRAGLEASVCDCYGIVRDEYARVIEPRTGRARARE